MAYATISLVSAYLGGVTINDSSAVTSTQVSDWLDWADAEINKISGSKFITGSVTTSNYEYVDYDGSGYIYTEKKPIIAIQEISYDNLGLGNASSPNWVALTEGRTNTDDFIVYKEIGKIVFHGTAPYTSPRGTRLAYTYGYATTPDVVKELATALVAKKWLQAVNMKDLNDSPSNISVGSISLSGGTKSAEVMLKLNERIEELKKLVGVLDIRTLI